MSEIKILAIQLARKIGNTEVTDLLVLEPYIYYVYSKGKAPDLKRYVKAAKEFGLHTCLFYMYPRASIIGHRLTPITYNIVLK